MRINSHGFLNKQSLGVSFLRLKSLKQIILRASLGTLVLFAGFLAIFPILGPAPALAGTTTLVTYYPAPNGNYSKVTLYPQAQPSGVCRSGAMYVDNTTGAFNYCVDSNINPNGGGLIGGTLAGTGAWGNLQTVNPVHYYDVANKGYVDAAAGPPGSWTCTTRGGVPFSSVTACQGTEKAINGGCYSYYASFYSSYQGCFIVNPFDNSRSSYSGIPLVGSQGWSCSGGIDVFGYPCLASVNCCK